MLQFAQLIAKAGISNGVVNIVIGHSEPCGRALTSHRLVALISFTGGPNDARHIPSNYTHDFAKRC